MEEPVRTYADNRQKGILHIAKAQMNMSREDYEKHLLQFGGCVSSRRLLKHEADELIDHFEREHGFVKKPGKKRDQSPIAPQCRRPGEVYHHQSSLKGLKNEIEEYAKKRWGQHGWERPLMSLARKITKGDVDRWQWVNNFYHLKAIKAAILAMEAKGSYVQHQRHEALGQEDPF